jgi:Rod binding domain-containing protein
MATAVDINAFRASFVELAIATDPQIAQAMNMADVMLGSGRNWTSQDDFAMARKLYTAHLLTLQLMQISSDSDGGIGLSDLFVQQIRFGERHISYGQRQAFNKSEAADPSDSLLYTTVQGQLFMQLRDRNIIPVMLV